VSNEESAKPKAGWLSVVVLLACAGLILLLRLHALDLPLSSLEADFGFVGQRLLAGDALYVDVWGNKPPTLYWTYALALWLFGGDDHAIRWLGIAASCLSMLALYACARQLFSRGAALWAACVFSLLTVEPSTHSHRCEAEIFITPFWLAALALALRYLATRRLLWLALSGLCVGIASTYKIWHLPHIALLAAVAWLGPGNAWRLSAEGWRGRLGRIGVVAACALGPALWWLGWAVAQGIVREFFDAVWWFNVNNLRVEMRQPNALLNQLSTWWELCWGGAWSGPLRLFWYAAILCALGLLFRRGEPLWRLAAGWTLFTFWQITTGPTAYNYYFIVLLPLAWLTILGSLRTIAGRRQYAWLALNVALAGLFAVHIHAHYLKPDMRMLQRALWGHDHYLMFRLLGQGLQRMLQPDERLYYWGFDTVNFYSQRRSGTRYHWIIPRLWEPWRLEQLTDEVIRNKPMAVCEVRNFPPMPPRLRQFVLEHYEAFGDFNFATLWIDRAKARVSRQRSLDFLRWYAEEYLPAMSP
jgi:4-amino-4-deoxy-L-arabinose transferase-like glycosyltransferase